MENTHWLINEKLLDDRPELKKDLVNTLISMRAVLNLKSDVMIPNKDTKTLAYLNALDKSAIHAYQKRLMDLEEFRLPESLLAIIQYEFQAEMLLKKTEVPVSIKMFLEYVVWTIGSFRKRWNIEPFEDTNLKIGWQHFCKNCITTFFSNLILPRCPDCDGGVEMTSICTYPHGYEIKDGGFIRSKMSDFAPSNGSEEKAIASIKKLLGVGN